MDQKQLQGAQHQLALDLQQLLGAQQHLALDTQQLALDQQQLQGTKRQLTLDQEQLQDAQQQLILDQQQLQRAKRQLTLDQEQLQGAQHLLALDQQQLHGAQHQLHGAQHQITLDQQQLLDAQHQLSLNQQQLQGAQHQLAMDQQLLERAQQQITLDQQQQHGAQQKEEPTNTVTETKRFTDCSVPDLYRMYMQEQTAAGQPAVSLHTFMALMPPWIVRLSAAQRQVCVCKTCWNIKLMLTVPAQHKAGLALELLGPAPGTAAPLPAAPGAGTAAPPPGALGAAGEDGDGVTAHLLAADSPFVDPNGEFEHPHPHHHLPVPPPDLAAFPTQLSATTVRGLYMCSCGPDAPHQTRCCHRTCSDCKDKCKKLKPGVDGSIMLSVKQYAPVKQKEGPARIELQQFRLSLHEVVDKLNEQMPSYIWHHFVAHHQLAVFRL
ncbi:hypothetical protein QJQ45_029951 [Haematococcus lacustris]|nr:hypothetical protein QJQ45_029951 [Haematococcus lacustris]